MPPHPTMRWRRLLVGAVLGLATCVMACKGGAKGGARGLQGDPRTVSERARPHGEGCCVGAQVLAEVHER